MNVVIAPSILSADFFRLGQEVNDVLQGGADWLHVDVMDGRFVPNITMGPLVVSALRKGVQATLDVHLMIAEPERYIDAFAQAGADIITVHYEATAHIHRALQQIRGHGLRAGLALNPGTPPHMLRGLVGCFDMLLVMTVNPGFGGQAFIPQSVDKIREARQQLDECGFMDVPIEVDGGINTDTIALAHVAGASVFVAGSAVFGEANRGGAIGALRQAAHG